MKNCKRCGAVLVQRANEQNADFRRRMTCGVSARCRRPPEAARECCNCGGVLQQKRTESYNNFRQRQCCSVVCSNKMRARTLLAVRAEKELEQAELTARARGGAWPSGICFEDDPRAGGECGGRLSVLPPPTETGRGGSALA